MTGLMLAAALTFSPTILASPESGQFGTHHYDTVVRGHFQERILVEWPGPSGLMALWQSGELNRWQKKTLLLGGAVFHDPQLLPIYREALLRGGPMLRQAAAYGYRDLIGDIPPNVREGVSVDVAKMLVGELDAVAQTVRRASLVEMWTASMLEAEGQQLPDWRGITFKKTSVMCLKAIERLVGPEDLDLIVRAYQLSQNRSNRIALMRLIGGLSMNQFVFKPRDQGKGWGPRIYDEGFERLDRWLSLQCDLEASPVLEKAAADLGVRGLDLLGPEACDVWLQILVRAPATSWAVAADRLYLCGGPAIGLSLTRPDEESNRNARQRLKTWYGY